MTTPTQFDVDIQIRLTETPDRWSLAEVKDIIRNHVAQALIDLRPAGVEFYFHGVGVTRLDQE